MKEPKCHRCVEFKQAAIDAQEMRGVVVEQIETYLRDCGLPGPYILGLLDRLK